MVLKRPKYASKISPTLLHHQRQAELWIILTLPFDRSSRNAFPFFCCPILVSPCELKSKFSVLSWQLWYLVWTSASGCSSAYLLPIWVVVALLWHQQGIVTLENCLSLDIFSFSDLCANLAAGLILHFYHVYEVFIKLCDWFGGGGYYLSVVNVVFVNILCCTRQKASRRTGLKGSLWCTAMLHNSTAVESNLRVTFAAVLTTLTLGAA